MLAASFARPWGVLTKSPMILALTALLMPDMFDSPSDPLIEDEFVLDRVGGHLQEPDGRGRGEAMLDLRGVGGDVEDDDGRAGGVRGAPGHQVAVAGGDELLTREVG